VRSRPAVALRDPSHRENETMPHMTLEYTRNLDLDPEAALRSLNEEMYASGLFAEADIKSRAVALDLCRRNPLQADGAYAVGVSGCFFHVRPPLCRVRKKGADPVRPLNQISGSSRRTSLQQRLRAG